MNFPRVQNILFVYNKNHIVLTFTARINDTLVLSCSGVSCHVGIHFFKLLGGICCDKLEHAAPIGL